MQDLNEETIQNVYKNAHIALQSISNVIDEVPEERMRDELKREYEGYEKIIGELSSYIKENGLEPKDINPMKKAMLYTSIKMNTLTDDSVSHVSEMMVKGTVMGITELKQLISRGENKVKPEILELAKKLCALEEEYEQKLKELL